MNKHVLLVVARLIGAIAVALALPLAHLHWGEVYPGDGQQATGFIIIFIFIGAVGAGIYLLLGCAIHFFMRNKRAGFIVLFDLVLCLLFVCVLAYGGITAHYEDAARLSDGRVSLVAS